MGLGERQLLSRCGETHQPTTVRHHTAQTPFWRPGCTNVSPGPQQQRNQNCRFSQIQRNWSRNQNSRLTPESRESGQKSKLPVYCLPGCEVGITLTNLSSKSPHGFFSSIQGVRSIGGMGRRFVKCKTLNTCQNNKMTNDKFKLVKMPPHSQKPSEVFV